MSSLGTLSHQEASAAGWHQQEILLEQGLSLGNTLLLSAAETLPLLKDRDMGKNVLLQLMAGPGSLFIFVGLSLLSIKGH